MAALRSRASQLAIRSLRLVAARSHTRARALLHHRLCAARPSPTPSVPCGAQVNGVLCMDHTQAVEMLDGCSGPIDGGRLQPEKRDITVRHPRVRVLVCVCACMVVCICASSLTLCGMCVCVRLPLRSSSSPSTMAGRRRALQSGGVTRRPLLARVGARAKRSERRQSALGELARATGGVSRPVLSCAARPLFCLCVRQRQQRRAACRQGWGRIANRLASVNKGALTSGGDLMSTRVRLGCSERFRSG